MKKENEIEELIASNTNGDTDYVDTRIRYGHFHVRMLPCKLVFLLYYGATYVLRTFLIPFLVTIGMHPGNAGVIVGARFALSSISSCLIGMVLTKTKKYIFTTAVCLICSTLAVLGVAFVPYYSHGERASAQRESSDTKSERNTNNQTVFFVSLAFSCLYAIFDGVLFNLNTLFNLAYCEMFGKANSYSWQRLWGSVGYAVMPFITGVVCQYWNGTFISRYLPAVLFFCILQLPLIAPLLYLSRSYQTHFLQEEPDSASSNRTKILQLLKKPKFLLLLFLQIMFGAANAIEFGYLLVFLESHTVNGNSFILAWACLSQSLFESLVSPLVGRILQKTNAPLTMIAVGLVGYASSFLLYFYTTDAKWIIGINMIIGGSFASYLFPMTQEIYAMAGTEVKALAFAIAFSCYDGVGHALGSIIGGFLFDYYGGKLYLFTSFLFFAIAIPLMAIIIIKKVRKSTVSTI